MIIHLKGEFDTRRVWLNGELLTPERSQKVRNHSPDGFNWGYEGSGPAQLALAILLSATSEGKAKEQYQAFKSNVIACLPKNFEREFDITKYLQ